PRSVDFCFIRVRRRPSSTLFPYTTLFRSGLDTAGYLGPDGRGLALGGSAGDPREVDGEARPLVRGAVDGDVALALLDDAVHGGEDRKSTRLNSSHDQISYAVFCLKKKKKT